MSAVDTNVLVRYYVRDDEEQFQKAFALFQQATIQNPLYINHIVLTEWVWVLNRAYKIRKKHIVRELKMMFDSKEIEIEDKETVRLAVQEFTQSNADFSDCLISVKKSKILERPDFHLRHRSVQINGDETVEVILLTLCQS